MFENENVKAKVFEAIRKSPLYFAESLLVDPFLDKQFTATYPQKQIFSSTKKTTWIAVHRRGGKMQPLYSKVYTVDGPKEMGSIQVGEEVCTPDGKTAKVTAIIPHGKQTIYRIHLIDGSYVDSGAEHDWVVLSNQSKKVTKTSAQLYQEYTHALQRNMLEAFNYKIPEIEPIQHSPKDLPIPPFTLGVLISTGNLKTGITRRVHPSITAKMQALSPGLVEALDGNQTKGFVLLKFPELKELFKEDYNQESLVRTRRIPTQYLYGSIEQRFELLKGILEGYIGQAAISRQMTCLIFDIFGEGFANDFIELARSLGCRVKYKKSLRKWTTKRKKETIIREIPAFNLTVHFPSWMTDLVLYNGEHPVPLYPDKLRRSIVKVTKLEEETEMQCISIDHPDRLYLTDHYIPTHNCVAEDSLIIDPNTLRPILIRDAKNVNKTLTFDFIFNKVQWAPCEWVSSGEKNCRTLVLASGQSLTLTLDHQLFAKQKGWATIQELKIGDQILAPSELPIFGSLELDHAAIEDHYRTTVRYHQIPDEVFSFTRATLIKYFGWFITENSTNFRREKRLGILLPSPGILKDLQHLLLRLGVSSRIECTASIFRLWIEEEPDYQLLLSFYDLGPGVLEVRSPRKWDRIIDIVPAGKLKTYDLMVEHQDHNFITNNTVVHNSYALSILAIWHAIIKEARKIVIFAPASNQVDVIFDNIDAWIYKNPVLEALKSSSGNFKSPRQQRTFSNGSTIQGFPLGVTGGLEAGKRGITADVVLCLPYHERILTELGWVPIGEIVEKNLAQEVLTYNHTKNTLEWKKILKRIKNPIGNRKLVELKTSDSRLQLTEDHKIFTVEEGYKKAKDFKQNNTILQIPFDLPVEEVYQGKAKLEDPVYPAADDYPVYDLTIEDNHNFFAEGVLVHNCDEAQEFSDEDWKVVGPIMKGDRFRMHHMKNYVTGTINKPQGYFFEKITRLVDQSKTESVIRIPVTENLSYSPEDIQLLEAETPPREWKTEWLLQADELDTSVFRIMDVEACSNEDWIYGTELIKPHLSRFIGIDWDKTQAGSNIAVVQYDPELRSLQLIYREEVPRGEFTYLDAVNRVIALYEAYSPDLVIADQGAGEMQWEYLMAEGVKRRNGLSERLVKKAFNTKIETYSLETDDIEKKNIKPFLVGQLQKKIQERLFKFPKSDKILKDQLLQYEVKQRTGYTVRFSSSNEHIIDCCLFCLWGIWYLYENWLTDADPNVFKNVSHKDQKFPWEKEYLDMQATSERFSYPALELPREPLYGDFSSWNDRYNDFWRD